MSFRAIVSVSGREVPLPRAVPPWAVQEAETGVIVVSLELCVDELDLAWQACLTSSGNPSTAPPLDDRPVVETDQQAAQGSLSHGLDP